MEIFDISQELFNSVVFEGDPRPEKQIIAKIPQSPCNLSALSMCAHNGTHIDAPFHFINDGKTIESLELNKMVGYAFVCECSGQINKNEALEIVKKAKAEQGDAYKRLLLKGKIELSNEGASVFVNAGIYLIGVESQTVGPESAPMQVHKTLLESEIVILEGIRLKEVEQGTYLLCSAPLKLEGLDGSPCRAILIKM